MLSSKIANNMREYKNGRFKSPKQAIAVAYAQVLKQSPGCKRELSRKTRKTKSRKVVKTTKKSRKVVKTKLA
jgi:hypothetical protein